MTAAASRWATAITCACLSLGCGTSWLGGDAPTAEEPQPDPKKKKKNRKDRKNHEDRDACGVWGSPGQHEVEVIHGSQSTSVQIYVPDRQLQDTVVVLLHGGDGTASRIMKQTGYRKIADREGVVLAMPEGVLQPDKGKLKWNSGKSEVSTGRDDIAFLDALAALAKAPGCVEHVAAVGFSNGAQMAHRWGCEGQQLDAVVAAAGGLLVPHSTCGSRTLPVLNYAGAKDGALTGSPTEHRECPSIQQTCDWWREHNGCEAQPTTRTIGRTTCETWSGPAPLRLCVTADMGHGFPKPEDGGVDGASDSWEWLQTVL